MVESGPLCTEHVSDLSEPNSGMEDPTRGRGADLHRVRAAEPLPGVLGDLGDHHLPGQGVPHEHHAALVAGHAVPAVRDRADLDRTDDLPCDRVGGPPVQGHLR